MFRRYLTFDAVHRMHRHDRGVKILKFNNFGVFEVKYYFRRFDDCVGFLGPSQNWTGFRSHSYAF